MILDVDPDSAVPAYEQLRAQISTMIVTGTIAPGERLPAIRRLASDLGIAVGTVQRAYRELETHGFVVGRGRRGTVVTEPATWRTVHRRDEERAVEDAARRLAVVATQAGLDVDAVHAALTAALGAVRPSTTGAAAG